MAPSTTVKTIVLARPEGLQAGDLVDTKTAAKLLGLRNHHTLEVWRSAKRYPELRYYRVGRAIRYRTEDIYVFLFANLVEDIGRSLDEIRAVKAGRQ